MISFAWPRRIVKVLSLIAFLADTSGSGAFAQTINSVTPITFGRVTAASAGSIVVDALSNTRSAELGVTELTDVAVQRGAFVITGTPNAQVHILVPAEIIISVPGAAILKPVIAGGEVQTIGADGTLTVFLGGRLEIADPVVEGDYVTIIPVSVDYLP
jgi:hypothetical protein